MPCKTETRLSSATAPASPQAPTLGALPLASLQSCASMRPRCIEKLCAKLTQSRRTSMCSIAIYRSSCYTACKTDTIAPHIHVLYRDIPFILNITTGPTGRAPIIKSCRLPAWQIHGLHVIGFETGLLKQAGNGPVEVATAGQAFPDRVETVLPTLNTLVRRFPMFAKYQLSRGFQNASDLIQCLVDIGNGAHRESHQYRIGTVVVQWNGFSAGLDEFCFQVMVGRIFLCN